MVENENLFHDYGMRKNTTLRISFFVFLYIYYDGVDLNLLIYLLISVQLNTMIVVLLNLLSTFNSSNMVISQSI